MSAGSLCTRSVLIIDKNESVRQAAELMRQHHVGDLVVIDAGNPYRTPVGMLTDRDITVEVVALGVAPENVKAGDIMSRRMITVREDEDQREVAHRMREAGIRRVPVVASDGGLVGILSMDDLLESISEELNELTHVPGRQRFHETAAR